MVVRNKKLTREMSDSFLPSCQHKLDAASGVTCSCLLRYCSFQVYDWTKNGGYWRPLTPSSCRALSSRGIAG